MGLSKREIELLITKIRRNYYEYAEKYNSKWFNIEDFEDRLEMTLRNKMNIEGFLLAEVANLAKTKDLYEKKKKERSFSEVVDKKIEENISRIKKYSEIRFHPIAGFEISHFYGAMAEFALYYFPMLWITLKKEQKHRLYHLEDSLFYLAAPRGSKPSKRIDDHILVLLRPKVKDIEIEKDKNEYLKESAFLLHEIINFINNQLNDRDSDWGNPLTFDQLYVEGERKKTIIKNFSGCTTYDAIVKIKEIASQIIEDFRLGAFKKRTSDSPNR